MTKRFCLGKRLHAARLATLVRLAAAFALAPAAAATAGCGDGQGAGGVGAAGEAAPFSGGPRGPSDPPALPAPAPFSVSPEKLRWLSPRNAVRDAAEETLLFLEAVGAAPGDRVADIGAGIGYFAEKFARQVGPAGRVWAIEADPQFVRLMQIYVSAVRLDNVSPRLTAMDDPGVPEPVDAVALYNLHTFCEPAATRAWFARLRPNVKPDGTVVVFTDSTRLTPAFGTCQLPLDELLAAIGELFRVERAEPFPPAAEARPGSKVGFLLVLRPR